MEGVKQIICDYCGKVCFRSFMGKIMKIDCDCDKPENANTPVNTGENAKE